MVDFTKIEVGKLFPGSVPVHEGVQMELWHDKLTMLIQMRVNLSPVLRHE
ncbi:MAG: hypothetical protein JRI92_13685 [Deltaproteobacteria bacterium]|nr:hypothetical protein [Deltaproteobacteria bacterium]